MHAIAWKQVNGFIVDTLPTWCNTPSAKQKENASAGSFGLNPKIILRVQFEMQKKLDPQTFRSPKCSKDFAFSSGAEQDTDTSGVLNAKMLPWLENSLAVMNGGIRRPDQELVVAFCNLPSAGVVSANKQHFVLTQITALAHSFPRSFVGVIVMPNRGSDLRHSKPPGCKKLQKFVSTLGA